MSCDEQAGCLLVLVCPGLRPVLISRWLSRFSGAWGCRRAAVEKQAAHGVKPLVGVGLLVISSFRQVVEHTVKNHESPPGVPRIQDPESFLYLVLIGPALSLSYLAWDGSITGKLPSLEIGNSGVQYAVST